MEDTTNTRDFQIELNYSSGTKSWIYFQTTSTDEYELCAIAVEKIMDDYQEQMPGFMGDKPPARPTILIKEVKHGTDKPVHGGIRIKTTWR